MNKWDLDPETIQGDYSEAFQHHSHMFDNPKQIDKRFFNMEWIKCSDQPAPKVGKFLYSYHCGIGLGEWGQCYTINNGNSERSHKEYILILWPSEILDGNDPYTWNEEKMVEMDVSWMPLPESPKE